MNKKGIDLVERQKSLEKLQSPQKAMKQAD